MAKNNSTFTGGDPTWANACVGENGFPGYWEYSKGFSQAATILINLTLATRGLEHSVDELIYPVCFNMRHSVELRLKGAISELAELERQRDRVFQFDFSGSHDIKNIWAFFTKKCRSVDGRYEQIIERLNCKIRDIAEVDATGQTFRYPLDTESKKHLVDVSVINFLALKHSFTELEAALDDLHRLNIYLRNEYTWGSFTKTLSRRDLFELATLLPPRSTWKEESFGAQKETIKGKFSIGSKELSDAIKRIESHFELAPEIGMSVPLLGVEEVDIQEFFGHWFEQHELPSDKNPIDLTVEEWTSDAVVDDMKKASAVKASVWDSVQSSLSAEALAGLSALYYFARDLDFSESYTRTYELNLREANAAFSASKDAVRTKYFHLFEKTNAVCNMLQSLYFLRKVDLADHLVATYGLDAKFSWLDDARSRSMFRKSDYCGYTI